MRKPKGVNSARIERIFQERGERERESSLVYVDVNDRSLQVSPRERGDPTS